MDKKILWIATVTLALGLPPAGGCGGVDDGLGQGPAAAGKADDTEQMSAGACGERQLAFCRATVQDWPAFQAGTIVGLPAEIPRCDEPECEIVERPPASNSRITLGAGVTIDYVAGDPKTEGHWVRCAVRYRLTCGKPSTDPDDDLHGGP